MSTGMDIEFVRKFYRDMSDAELIAKATISAAGLTPEAQEIIKEEIRFRKLGQSLINAIDAQNRVYTADEINELCHILQQTPCPDCNSQSYPLNASLYSETISFIVFTTTTKKLAISCPDCINKINNRAIIKSLLLGWWGLPWGPIRTIKSLIINFRNKQNNYYPEPNITLQNFVRENIGLIENDKNNSGELKRIISNLNR